MRIAQIIGSVTLSRAHPTFENARLKLAQPFSWEELQNDATQSAQESLVLWDDLSAGPGERIALSEGAEAAQPFRPEVKPVDAYNAAILDQINVNPEVL